jgi:hypothetical protein
VSLRVPRSTDAILPLKQGQFGCEFLSGSTKASECVPSEVAGLRYSHFYHRCLNLLLHGLVSRQSYLLTDILLTDILLTDIDSE